MEQGQGGLLPRTIVLAQYFPLHIEDGINYLLLLARHLVGSLQASAFRKLAEFMISLRSARPAKRAFMCLAPETVKIRRVRRTVSVGAVETLYEELLVSVEKPCWVKSAAMADRQ